MIYQEKIKIRNKQYGSDKYGNIHQLINYDNYGVMLNFYRKKIYFSGKFRNTGFFFRQSEELDLAIEREAQSSLKLVAWLRSNGFIPEKIESVLDFGCGVGSTLNEFSRLGINRLEGWEISEESPNISQNIWPHSSAKIRVVEILNHLQILSTLDKWDLLIACDIIEHIRFDNSFLRGIKSLLNRGGTCIVELPIFSTNEIASLEEAEYLYPEHHIHLYSYDGFARVADECGWKIKNRALTKNRTKAFYAMELD